MEGDRTDGMGGGDRRVLDNGSLAAPTLYLFKFEGL